MKYLYEKNDTVFAECEDCGRILKFKKYQLENIKTGVECFCGSKSDSITNLPVSNKVSGTSHQIQVQKMKAPQGSASSVTTSTSPAETLSPNAFLPKCPTCGSTRIHKISLVSKAVGGYMWGIFSSNVRNTFECYNCGYKW